MKVDRVTVALDTRYMVNPLTIAEQAEGSVIFGLSAALYGKITIKDGAAVQGNFDTYRMVRLAEAPKIDVHLVPSGGKVWGGAGEPATAADRRRGGERDLRRDRQAHSHAADQRSRSALDRHSRRISTITRGGGSTAASRQSTKVTGGDACWGGQRT